MRILWHSNAPFSNSGYGQQTGLFAPRIQALGHPLAVSAYYGLEGGVLNYNGYTILPKRFHPYGNDVFVGHSQTWNADISISLMDVWVMEPEGYPFGFKWCPWFPIDHEPMPQIVRNKLNHAYKRIAMSKFGVRMTQQMGLDCYYIPHGIDTKIFYPRDKAESRKELGLPADKWIVGTVAMNKGNPSRKNFTQMIEAFANFKARHADAFYFLQTDRGEHGNDVVNIPEVFTGYGLKEGEDYALCNPYQNYLGYPPDYLAKLYSAFDVHMLVSAGEGFGIPILEAQACFPAETKVEAKGVFRGMVKNFTGDLVQIHTKRGMIEATPNHPFWTDKGWIQAKDLNCALRLLYNSSYEEKLPQIHTGRIGDIVSSLPKEIVTRDRSSNGENVRVATMATSPLGSYEINGDLQVTTRVQSSTNAIGLYRRTDRRRGNNLGSPNEIAQTKAIYQNSQHLDRTNGLVGISVDRPVYLSGAQTASHQATGLHVPYRRAVSSSALQGARTVSNDQAPIDEADDRIYRTQVSAITQRAVHTSSTGDRPDDTNGEYEPILKIGRRSVTNLPVYNFTTESSTYLANGYLVHNCGTPVIVGDWTAMSELCLSGHMVVRKDAEKFWTPLAAFQYRPHIRPVELCMEAEYRKATPTAKTVEYIQSEYDVDAVTSKYWAPVLTEIEGGLK